MPSSSKRPTSVAERWLQLGLKVFITAMLLAWLVLQVYPIFFLFITSLKSDPDILSAPYALPFPPQFSNYTAVIEGGLTNQSILVYFSNSVIITAGTLI